MLGCPNRASQEWKDVYQRVVDANPGINEDELYSKALEIWEEEGYSDNPYLNEPEETEEVADQTDDELKEGEFGDAVKKIRYFVDRKLNDLKRVKIKDKTLVENQYKALKENLEALDGVESINMFVNDAYQKSLRAKKRLANLLAKKDKKDPKELLDELVSLNDFANGYSILDEISKQDVYTYFSKEVPEKNEGQMTPQEKLTSAIATRNNIRSKFISEAIPLIAKTLIAYRSDRATERTQAEIDSLKAQINAVQLSTTLSDKAKANKLADLEKNLNLYEGYLLDEEKLEGILKEASKDESTLDFLINPLISSEDSALALFAKMIKSSFEDARIQDEKIQRDVAKEYQDYTSSIGGTVDNMKELYKDIYEVIEIPKFNKDGSPELDADGKPVTMKRVSFVQKYDISKFKAAEKAMYDRIGPEPILSEKPTAQEKQALKAWKRERANWYRTNKQAKSQDEIDKILAQKLKEKNAGLMSESEHQAWKEANMYFDERTNKTVYIGSLSEPSDAYINNNWKMLYDASNKPIGPKGKYHKYLTDMYLKAQEKLPEGGQMGYYIPSVPKTELERMGSMKAGKYAKTRLREAINIQAYDTEYGVGTLSEENVRFLPLYYTQPMDFDDISLDLTRSVLMFSGMANRYEAMNSLHSEITAFKTIIGERKVLETNSKGQVVIDAVAKKLGYDEYIKKNGESNSKKHLDAFIEMVVYGESQKATEVLGLSLGKITDTVMGISAKTTLALDLLKGVANNIQGNLQVIIEANAAEFFNKKDFAKAKGIYTKSMGAMLADFNKPVPDSLVGRLIDYYDAMQGEFTDEYGKKVTGSMFNKLFRSNTLFFNQHLGEHEVQTTTMLALMNATKVIDKNTGLEISLYEAHEKYGVEIEELEKNTDFTEKKRKDFQNELHALNKRMQGVYNEFDKGTLQRYALGRLVLLYRKYFIPAMKRRWKKNGFDEELGASTEGIYITFYKTMMKDLVRYKGNIMEAWSTYTPFQKAQIRRTVAEITILMSLVAILAVLAFMVGSGDDEDEELKANKIYNFVLYEAIRMRSETAQYINPGDVIRVMRSPSAIASTVERAMKFTNQIMPWNITEEYKKESGVWEKGDNKAWAYFLKLMGFSGNNLDPAQAVKAFQSTIL
jgi:hypothetical protein